MKRSSLSGRIWKQYLNIGLGFLTLAVMLKGLYGFEYGLEALLDPQFLAKVIAFSIALGLFFGPLLLMPLIVEILKARGFDLNALSDDYQGPRDNWKVWSQKYFLSTGLVFVFFALGAFAISWFRNEGSLIDFDFILLAPLYLIIKLVTYPSALLFRRASGKIMDKVQSGWKMNNPYAMGIPRAHIDEKSSPVETGEDQNNP